MSSFRLVPPVVTITSTPRCLPSSLQTCDVWRASSRVGTRRSAARASSDQNRVARRIRRPHRRLGSCHAHWMQLRLVSQRSRTGMQKAAVLPVPFLALASTSRLRASESRNENQTSRNDSS